MVGDWGFSIIEDIKSVIVKPVSLGTFCLANVLSHSIKYSKLFELQLMLICILKVCLVAVLTISKRGSKYSQVGQNGRSHCVEEALMLGS